MISLTVLKTRLVAKTGKAVMSLRKRTDIIIKPVDKGSAMVIMSPDDYWNKVMNHHGNGQYYKQLSTDPTEQFSEEITVALAEMVERRAIDKDTIDFLWPHNARTSWIYILPKIHKAGIPGRPIVSSCGAPTEKISRLVDHHLSPLVKNIPSYTKDINDFLLKLQEVHNLAPESLLMTLNVTCLYTNIPYDEGLEACREILKTRIALIPPADDIIDLISLNLKKNNFTFNNMHYLQNMEQQQAPEWPHPLLTSSWEN